MAIFNQALEYFDAREWWHGDTTPAPVGPTAATCLWLAVASGAGIQPGSDESDYAKDVLSTVIGQKFVTIRAIFDWNDAQTSRQTVREALGRAVVYESEHPYVPRCTDPGVLR